MQRKGYVLVLVDVHDAGAYAEYARRATELEARHGGRTLVAGAAADVIEGPWPSERTVVLEFPSIDHARAWYDDPDYRDVLALRHEAADSRILFVEGFRPGD